MNFIKSKLGRRIGRICCVLTVIAAIILITFPFYYVYMGGSALRGFTQDGLYFVARNGAYQSVDYKLWLWETRYEAAAYISVPVLIFLGSYALVYTKMRIAEKGRQRKDDKN